MPAPTQLEQALLRILWYLRDYLPDVVVIGGWVPHLYRRFGGFATWLGEISLTGEVDTLVAPALPAGDRSPITTILRQAGFRPIEDGPVAAVWANRPEAGERIEFLLDHAGPFGTLGEIRAVGDQPGLGAISLEGLWLLGEHIQALEAHAGAAGLGAETLLVRVPRLGAYVINKAVTFPWRRDVPGGHNPKRAKDLLYIRDLMAAGAEVAQRIAVDIAELTRTSRRTEQYIGRAAANLRQLSVGTWGQQVIEAAEMLRERDPRLSSAAARADIDGHLADLMDVLKGIGV